MRRALLFALALISLPAAAVELTPFAASYTADWKQLPVSGSAERRLQALDNGLWKLNFEASMLVASVTEESTLRVENDALQPYSYLYERNGLGKGKKVEQRFDWQACQQHARCRCAGNGDLGGLILGSKRRPACDLKAWCDDGW